MVLTNPKYKSIYRDFYGFFGISKKEISGLSKEFHSTKPLNPKTQLNFVKGYLLGMQQVYPSRFLHDEVKPRHHTKTEPIAW